MTVSGKIILACWIAYAVYWTVSAQFAKATAERQDWASVLAHRIPTLLGAILLFWGRPPHPFDARLTPGTALMGYAGATVCGLGLAVAVWARKTIAGNWSSGIVLKEGHELVQHGPYRFVRHPIYTGILMMCLSLAMAAGRMGSWLGFLLVFAGFWLKLKKEEALMARHFPDEYASYRARTKALVPFVV